LSALIDALNKKFGTDFTDEDLLFFEQIMEQAQSDDEVRRKAKTNSDDKFELGIRETIKKLMMVRMKENEDIVSRYLDDEAFQKTALRILAREIYANLNVDF
jgi:type I restriction enzyme R subunit